MLNSLSATNRGTARKEHDFYATPIDVVDKVLQLIDINCGGGVLDT